MRLEDLKLNNIKVNSGRAQTKTKNIRKQWQGPEKSKKSKSYASDLLAGFRKQKQKQDLRDFAEVAFQAR